VPTPGPSGPAVRPSVSRAPGKPRASAAKASGSPAARARQEGPERRAPPPLPEPQRGSAPAPAVAAAGSPLSAAGVRRRRARPEVGVERPRRAWPRAASGGRGPWVALPSARPPGRRRATGGFGGGAAAARTLGTVSPRASRPSTTEASRSSASLKGMASTAERRWAMLAKRFVGSRASAVSTTRTSWSGIATRVVRTSCSDASASVARGSAADAGSPVSSSSTSMPRAY